MKFKQVFGVLATAIACQAAIADSFIGGGCSDPHVFATQQPVASDEENAASGRPVGLFHRHHGRRSGVVQTQSWGSAGGYQVANIASIHGGGYSNAPSGNFQSGGCAPTMIGNGFGASSYGTPTGPACGPMSIGNVGNDSIAVQTDQRSMMDCGPVSSYKVVLEPKYFTETRSVPTTEYQSEVRYRTRTVARQVPVEVQDYRTVTVMVPRSETKSVEYTVLVPQTSEKSVEVVDTVPVWNEVSESYTVKVPQLVDVPEEYRVRVPQLSDQEFTYTVQVPQSQTETRMQSVTNAIPVTKSRTVQTFQPVSRSQTVTKDYGHWEDRVEEVAVAAAAPMASNVVYHSAVPLQMSTPVTSYGYAPAGCSAPVGGCGHSSGRGCVLGRGLFHRGGCGASAGCGLCGRHAGCGASGGCSAAGGCGVVSGYGTAGYTVGGCGNSVGCGVDGSYAPMENHYGVEVAQVQSNYAAPATQTVTRRVWVPNVVTEEVQVVDNVPQSQEVTYTVFEQQTTQVPYECTYIVYRPETRTGTRKVVNYVDETRTRTRKVVQYNEESRTRTRKVLSYKQETRSETIPVVTYTTEKRTKEVAFTINVPETRVEPITSTRYDTVNEEISESYTVSVPVASSKEVQVQVCRMVPKLVPITIYPCQCSDNVGSQGEFQGAIPFDGCVPMQGGYHLGTPSLAPALPNCNNCPTGCANYQTVH